MEYKIVLDLGKPIEFEVDGYKELKKKLTEIKEEYWEEEYFDVHIYDKKGEDITEAQFVQEMVDEILEEACDMAPSIVTITNKEVKTNETNTSVN